MLFLVRHRLKIVLFFESKYVFSCILKQSRYEFGFENGCGSKNNRFRQIPDFLNLLFLISPNLNLLNGRFKVGTPTSTERLVKNEFSEKTKMLQKWSKSVFWAIWEITNFRSEQKCAFFSKLSSVDVGVPPLTYLKNGAWMIMSVLSKTSILLLHASTNRIGLISEVATRATSVIVFLSQSDTPIESKTSMSSWCKTLAVWACVSDYM